VLARAFGDYRFARLQRLTADAYAAPHPGQADDRRAVQPVAVHLIGLALSLAPPPTLAPGRPLAPLLQAAANGSAMYRWLPLLADLGAVTVADVHAAVPSVALAQALSTTDEARGDRADKGAGDGAGQDARAPRSRAALGGDRLAGVGAASRRGAPVDGGAARRAHPRACVAGSGVRRSAFAAGREALTATLPVPTRQPTHRRA
jgi:hypothetical protein